MAASLDDEELLAAVSLIVGNEVRVSLTLFPGGAISLDLRLNDRFVSIDGLPSRNEWGVSGDEHDSAGFAGHSEVYDSFESALEAARRCFL